jgi:hypothetical protein
MKGLGIRGISLSENAAPLIAAGGERPLYVRDLSKKRQNLTGKMFRIIAETAPP